MWPDLARADRRCLGLLFVLLLAAYTLTMAGRLVSGDGEAMYQTTRALVLHRQLSIEPRPEAARGRNGHFYSKYGLAQSVVQAPFLVTGHLLGKLAGAEDDRADRFLVSLANCAVTAALVSVFWLTLLALGFGRTVATVAALVFGFATLAWPYARDDFSEPLQTLSLLASFYGFLRWRQTLDLRWVAAAGLAAGVCLLTKAASTILLAPLALYFSLAVWRSLRRSGAPPRAWLWRALQLALAAGVPFAACGLFQAALNFYRFGSVAEFGYGSEPATGFTTPLTNGVDYLLLSSGKGLFLFAPPVLIGLAALPLLWRRWPVEAATAALIFLAELLYYARWWAWHGDWCWGPRYMVVTIPFAMLGWGALLARWRDAPSVLRALAVVVVALGAYVSALGVAIDYGGYYSIVGAQLGMGVDVKDARLVPEFSPLLGHSWLAEASLYDALFNRGTDSVQGAHNPFLRDYPWARQHPELRPEAPERAVGFDFWFAKLPRGARIGQYWGALAAWWLLLALVPLSRQLWRAAGVSRTEVETRDAPPATYSLRRRDAFTSRHLARRRGSYAPEVEGVLSGES